MANEIKLKKWNGSAWVQQYPEVRHTDIVASGTPSSSNFLRGDGAWANVGDGNTKFYAWRAINNTTSNTGYYRIANVNGQASTRFQIEVTGRSSSYSDGALPNYIKILGQYNNDNNYDVWYFNNETGTSEAVTEVGIVDDGTNNVNIWVKVGSFSELTATAYLSDGTITTYDTNSFTSTAPTGYTAITEYKMWNSGNDGSGSGLDADTVDGLQASQFIRSDANDTVTGGAITFTGNIVSNGQIRSNTPSNNIAPINVKSDGEGQAIHIEETGSGAESWQLGVDTAGNLNFMNSGSGTPSIRFMDNDNVGIGVSTPTQKLDVAGSIKASNNMYAGRYYDLNDTAYYLDPASTSEVNNVNVRGDLVIDANNNNEKLYISRYGQTTQEFTSFSRDDTITHIHTKNDEESSTVRFRIENTDTETGGGADANDRNIDFISDATDARIVIDGNRVATESYVDTEIASLVASAPSTLDTLNELASALGDDANFSTTVTNSLAGKVAKSGDTMTGNLRIESGSFASLILDRGTTGSGSVLQFENNNGLIGGIGAFGDDGLQFRTANGTQMVLSSADRLGIGTQSPASKLEVNGDIQLVRTKNIIFGETVGGGARARIFSTENEFSADYNGLGFSTGANGRTNPTMYIRSTNNSVGIGTTTPAEKLEVVGKVRASENFEKKGSGGYYLYNSSMGFRGAFYDNGSATSIYGDGNGSTPVININSDNVGIGTTTPSEKLQVEGNIKLNSTLPKIQFTDTNNDSDFHIANNNGVLEIADTSNQEERFAITTAGNVGIGTTTPTQKLEVDGNINGNELHLNDTNTILKEGDNNTLRIQTNSGYTQIGPENSSWSHFRTDRGSFYFNKPVQVDGNIALYDNNTTKLENSTGYIYELGERVATQDFVENASGYWKQIKTGSTTITSGTSATSITVDETLLNQGGQDQLVIAFELNTSSVTSTTSEVHIVKLENSSSSAGGVLFNASASNASIQVGSIRVYRGLASTQLTFSYSYKFTNGSSSEIADTVYVGRVWKLVGVEGV